MSLVCIWRYLCQSLAVSLADTITSSAGAPSMVSWRAALAPWVPGTADVIVMALANKPYAYCNLLGLFPAEAFVRASNSKSKPMDLVREARPPRARSCCSRTSPCQGRRRRRQIPGWDEVPRPGRSLYAVTDMTSTQFSPAPAPPHPAPYSTCSPSLRPPLRPTTRVSARSAKVILVTALFICNSQKQY